MFIVRCYERNENRRVDITGALSYEDAMSKWKEVTRNGTEFTKYEDGSYFAIFPADTKMVFD